MCNKPMIDLEKLMREAEEKDMKEEEEEDLNGNPCINTRRWKRRGETCKRMCMYYGFTYILYPLLMLLAMLFHYAQILWHRVFVGDNGNNNDNHHAINGAGGRVFNLHGRGLIIDDINIDDGDMDEDFVLVDGDSDDSDSEDGAIDDAVDDSDEPGDGGLRRRR